MDNFLSTSTSTSTLIFVFIFLLWCIGKLSKLKSPKHSFKNGFKYANQVFCENNFRHSIQELNHYIEESKVFDSYDDFDRGVEQAVKEQTANTLNNLNETEGGDWYFCNESLVFKDSLTSREIIL